LTGFSKYIIIDKSASKVKGAKGIRCWKQQKFQGCKKICAALSEVHNRLKRDKQRDKLVVNSLVNSTLELTGLLTTSVT